MAAAVTVVNPAKAAKVEAVMDFAQGDSRGRLADPGLAVILEPMEQPGFAASLTHDERRYR